MKKILMPILLLLVAAAAALPWVNSLGMEKMAMEAMAQVNRMGEDSGTDILTKGSFKLGNGQFL